MGWALPNPVNAQQPDESKRFPFAAVVPAAADNTTYDVTFTVQDSEMSPIKGAKVSLGDLVQKTNGSGTAKVKTTANTYLYKVSADGYTTTYGEVKVEGAESVTVTLQN